MKYTFENYLEQKDVFAIEDRGQRYAIYLNHAADEIEAVRTLAEPYIAFNQLSTEKIDGKVYWKAPMIIG